MTLSRFLSLALAIACLPETANANVVIVPIGMLAGFSFSVAMGTVGLALAGVILIEALILRLREKLDLKTAFLLSTKANLLSTMLGLFIGALGSTGDLFLMAMPLLMAAFSQNFRDRCGINLGPFLLRYLISLGVCWAMLYLASLTVPGEIIRPARDFASPRAAYLAILAAMGLILYGFLMSVLSEAWFLCSRLRQSNAILTVVLMNLASYAFLAVASLPLASKVIQDRSWYWHWPDFKDPYDDEARQSPNLGLSGRTHDKK